MSNVERFPRRRVPTPKGKYHDRDYSLRGLGTRVDVIEDLIKDFEQIGDSIKKTVKVWGGAVVVALIASGAVNPQTGKFLAAFMNALH